MTELDRYDFFTKEFEFKGKHASMCQELWAKNDPEHSYFRRLLDIYIIAPIIGFRSQRKASEDLSGTSNVSIFGDTLRGAKSELDFILQMILMLERADEFTPKECADIAFRGAQTEEQFKEYNTLFNDYARGGVEILYEELVMHSPDIEDEIRHEKAANLMHLYRLYEAEY